MGTTGTVEVRVGAELAGTALLDDTGAFRLEPVGVDVVPGTVVAVGDGTWTKEHVVTALAVTAVDVTTDTVTGTADADLPVVVGVVDGEGQSAAQVDVLGPVWTADFAGTQDIVAGTPGYAGQSDADGDSTWVDWAAPLP